jgi:methyl-accepting chemotaxis protein
MPFDLANRSLVQKMSMLVLGITLFVSIVVGGFGDLMLRRLANDLVEAKLLSSVASLDRVVDSGGAALSPVKGPDGRVDGEPAMHKDPGLAVVTASLVEKGAVQNAAETIETLDEGSALGTMRKMLLMADVLVFAAVAFIGITIARGFLEPLSDLEREVDRLSKGDTNVQLSALSRSDEIGHMARSVATIRESLVELARLKAQRGSVFSQQSATVVTGFRELWDGIRTELWNVKELLASEGRLLAEQFDRRATSRLSSRTINSAWQSWKAWLTDEPSLGRPSPA